MMLRRFVVPVCFHIVDALATLFGAPAPYSTCAVMLLLALWLATLTSRALVSCIVSNSKWDRQLDKLACSMRDAIYTEFHYGVTLQLVEMRVVTQVLYDPHTPPIALPQNARA